MFDFLMTVVFLIRWILCRVDRELQIGRAVFPMVLIALPLGMYIALAAPGLHAPRTGGTPPAGASEALEPAGRRQVGARLQAVVTAPRVDGEAIYRTYCVTCHQEDGQGNVMRDFPPLSGSKWVTGDKGRLIRILLQGMSGPVEVKGTTYDGVMPPWKNVLSDEEIAAVATYVRTSWSNEASAVSASEVRRVRVATRGRAEPWTAEALLADAHTGIPEPDASALPAGRTAGAEESADATAGGSFEKVVLDRRVTYPMELDVAPDGRVFYIEREGAVKIWNPETKSTHMAGFIPVTTAIEDGLLGLVLDPNFQENHWLYLYHSSRNELINVLSRFTVRDGRIDMASERVLLKVPVQRKKCCHSAGSLAFGPEGNLFLSTGGNTSVDTRYNPVDERPGHALSDAQRTAANTNALRGKILRIHPLPGGSYSIPEGNLFPDTPKTRPEIYAMGLRNPWRISVDMETGWLYWGEVGASSEAVPGRLPKGVDEFNQAKEAGFYGWPYFVGPNDAYREYNYATGEWGEMPDPQHPINDSPNNTGLRELPPAQPPLIWYGYSPSEPFPEMGAGAMSAGVGPVYHYDSTSVGPHGLPAYYDQSLLIFEWARNWIKAVRLDEEGNILEILPIAPELSFSRPIDMAVGPKGRLYVLEWGPSFWGSNRSAKLVRLDYYPSEERPPVAVAAAGQTSGPAPLQVQFNGSQSYSRTAGGELTYTWDFDGDGQVDSHRPTPSYTYEEPGSYTARLTVTDAQGMSATAEVHVTVGNTAPEVSIIWPVEGGFFDFNTPIDVRARATDREDGTIPADQLSMELRLGHDTHTHLQAAWKPGEPEEALVLVPDSSHTPHIIDRFATLEVSYTDEGAGGAPPLTAREKIVLNPRRMEAENADSLHGAEVQITGSRQNPNFAEVAEVFVTGGNGDYLSYAPVNLVNIHSITAVVRSEGGGVIEMRLDAPEGQLLAELPVPGKKASSGQWQKVTVPVDNPGGPHELFLVFRTDDGGSIAIDRLMFHGEGIMAASTHR